MEFELEVSAARECLNKDIGESVLSLPKSPISVIRGAAAYQNRDFGRLNSFFSVRNSLIRKRHVANPHRSTTICGFRVDLKSGP